MEFEEKRTSTNTNIDAEGNVNISDDVIATIASIATQSVEGVCEMAGSITGGLVELFGKKNPSKGVKVSIGENNVKIDIFAVVNFGAKIQDVADEVQNKVKSEVEAMTGLTVTEVNVNIEGIRIFNKAQEQAENTDSAEADVEE